MTIAIADGRGALWQWDTGRRVKITDGEGVKQVHYQNKCFGRSVDVDVGDDGTAIIPDELLQDCHTLTAYAYVTDDTGAYTMVQQDFAVYKRAKPAGYVYTPTDQMTLQTIQRQIGDLAGLTTEAHDTLVAAINEVALMGGRMALRVADGYIQYSTDSGSTWTNLIAMADLKGAGMDITGAAAGQIAKIAAVDASGVPTAWSPVDMPDAVLYTAQTLTDAQKKQARENVDASSDFVVNGTVISDSEITLDKTFMQIREAALGGKRVFMRIGNGEAYTDIPLLSTNANQCGFALTNTHRNKILVQTIVVSNDNTVNTFYRIAPTFGPDGTLPQATMRADPTEAMQIATKKYVDDALAAIVDGTEVAY